MSPLGITAIGVAVVYVSLIVMAFKVSPKKKEVVKDEEDFFYA
jgi:hypothetical protein